VIKILITGGAGYIGSVLTPRLLDAGYKVTVVDNFSFAQSSLLGCCANVNFSVMKGDVRDESLMNSLYSSNDVIIPLAAIVGAPACDKNPSAALEVNYEVIKRMSASISADQKVIFPVTNSGYGIGREGIYCDEKSPLNPISLYGRTKVDAESILLNSSSAVTLRLATVFGASPRMRIDLLVNDFVYRAISDRFIVLFEAHFKRNYIHIHDVSNAIEFAIKNYDSMKGEAFNCGLSDANLSKLELCEKIKLHISDLHILESNVGEDPDKRDYIVSNEKLEALGWRPKKSLDDGIKELMKVYTMIRNGGKYDNLGGYC
jgi:nucleoside-diphosphate-sugar epimerase